jgi:thiamine pyrophosphokinase
MKRAIIFYNGDLSDIHRAKEYIKKSDFIICADGGARFVQKLNIVPQVIIGDFDSLPESSQRQFEKQPIEWVRFPTEKNETDSELALNYAIENGFKTIIVFGLFGSRMDHLLTNIFALSYLELKGIKVSFVEGNQEMQITQDIVQLKGEIGDLISLIPLKGDVKSVTTKNLQYKLKSENLYFGYSRGISNVMTAKTATVSINEGLLLVIHNKNND